MKKLLLIDGMALTYRSYYALNHNPRLNTKGMNTSAILGFTNTMVDLIEKLKPTHMAVAFDVHGPTFRHEQYPEYKANREPMPEDISVSLPFINQIISAFNIPIVTCQGWEADDVIGTLAHRAETEGFDEVLMATPDKDFCQLVTSVVRVYRFGRMKNPDVIMGIDEVLEKFGVSECTQVIDLLGLWGDAIDNIPGIPGVGEKTAKKLIAQFGSIEQMVEQYEEIKNEKIRNLVKEHSQQALFSKQLATIALDAPVDFVEDDMKLKPYNMEALGELFSYLEFRKLAAKLSVPLTSGTKEIPKEPKRAPELQESESQLDLFSSISEADTLPKVALDIVEEPMPVEGEVAIVMEDGTLNLSSKEGHQYSVNLNQVDFSALKKLMESEDPKICHNFKSIKKFLMEKDISLRGEIFDVELAHYLIDPEKRHTLDFMAGEYLNLMELGGFSSSLLWTLKPLLMGKLKQDGLWKLYKEVELPLVDVLISMEKEGVRIDTEAIVQYSSRLKEERNALEQEIFALADAQFNISSTKQLGEILYEKLRITDKPPRTATKQYSTSEDVLQKLMDSHPIVGKILEFRSLNKLIGTYLDSFPKLVDSKTGRLHTLYNQTVTATGRLSSSNPNLQNIPIRTERGREIRKAFVARNDKFTILAADYSQIELRIIAALSHDRQMIEDFTQGFDIHAATASKIYHVPMEDVTKDQRRNAKSVNFGIVYGISSFGLSEQLGISRKEAGELIEEYFKQYPAIKEFIEKEKEIARGCGFSSTLLGRRRYLYDINSRNANLRSFAERNAVNMPIQGTSADMIKIAMININNELRERNLQTRMILQVHDELVFDVYKPELEMVKLIVESEMKGALNLDIPIEVGLDVGQNWLEAH